MRKIDKDRFLLLQIKREKKRLKRLRSNPVYKGYTSVELKEKQFHRKKDEKIAETFESKWLKFFKEINFITGSESNTRDIEIPENFSFCDHYNESILVIKNIISSIYCFAGEELTIDFSKCKFCDQSALFVLQILRFEFQDELRKFDSRFSYLTRNVTYKITPSKNQEVNRQLFLLRLIKEAEFDATGLLPIDSLGYIKGMKSRKHYSENKKGFIATTIVGYLNACLAKHGYVFNPDGLDGMGGLISEVLNNAEDHSSFNTYYATGNLSKEFDTHNMIDTVGEVNLSFMNFGYSIFEGFENTKEENWDTYQHLSDWVDQINKHRLLFPLSKENLFTLYALQDGISRLKYQDESRGTGTMRFINSFFTFGDFEDPSKDYIPSLSILSGSTLVICNNLYKPVLKENTYVLALNEENDLSLPPNSSSLKSLKYGFPGTLLSVKIYLNKAHLNKKVNNNGNS